MRIVDRLLTILLGTVVVAGIMIALCFSAHRDLADREGLFDRLSSIVREDVNKKRSFSSEFKSYNISKIKRRPSVSMESIHIAMHRYNIQYPSGSYCEYPQISYDLGPGVRGVVRENIPMVSAGVYIGPAAFSSWAILGSTLAHEIEVHCSQDLLHISLMMMLMPHSSRNIETEAYLHELHGKNRFDHTSFERQEIFRSMLTETNRPLTFIEVALLYIGELISAGDDNINKDSISI